MSILLTSATGKLRFRTADPAGALYDPEDFSVILRDPSDAVGAGTEYVYVEGDSGISEIERTAFGEFLLRVPAVFPPGRWKWRATSIDAGDGDRVDVAEGSFMVRASRVVSNGSADS